MSKRGHRNGPDARSPVPSRTDTADDFDPNEKGLNETYFYSTGDNMDDPEHLIGEYVRNSDLEEHGDAAHIWVDLLHEGTPDFALRFIDDGRGLDRRRRHYFAQCWGFSTRETRGTGSGARVAALPWCQVIEVVTVPRNEPGKTYRLVMHLPTFVREIARGLPITQDWVEVPREHTDFPHALSSGALFLLRDFRASDKADPFDAVRMRPTWHVITRDIVRDRIHKKCRADLIRKIGIGDGAVSERLPEPKFEGFTLWKWAVPKNRELIGAVSGEILYATRHQLTGCEIGGSTATVQLQTFLRGCELYRSELAERIPRVFYHSGLIGQLIIHCLENYPVQDRTHLRPHFWSSDEVAAVVELLAREIGPEAERRLTEYESRPVFEEAYADLDHLLAQMHHAQGLTPGELPRGTGGTGTTVPAIPIEEQPLHLRCSTVALEQYEGTGEPDVDRLVVENVIAGETFRWDDGRVGLVRYLEDHPNREEIEVRSIRNVGTYAVDVQSEQHPKRNHRAMVRVHALATRTTPTEFTLRPQSGNGVVGGKKVVRICTEGGTTGPYEWRLFRKRSGSAERDRVHDLTLFPSGRGVELSLMARGNLILEVECLQTHTIAHGQYEIREPAPAPWQTPTHPENGMGAGEAGTGEGVGGPGSRLSAVVLSGRERPFCFQGTTFTVKLVEYNREPYMIRPEGHHPIIELSIVHQNCSGARSSDQRYLHFAWCLASAIRDYSVWRRYIDAFDMSALSGLLADAIAFAMSGGADESTASAPRTPPSRPSSRTPARGVHARTGSRAG